MDSPYRPGAGVTPPFLAGRDQQINEAADLMLRTAAYRSPRRSPLVLTGVRGIGKTVTLREIAQQAEAQRFVTVHLTVDRQGPLARRLAHASARAISESSKRSGALWRAWRSQLERIDLEISVAGVVTVSAQGAPQQTSGSALDAVLRVLADGAALLLNQGRPGLCITLDEIQEARRDDLADFCALAQELSSSPVIFVAAGLPFAPDRLMAASSFAERFTYLDMGPLDEAAAESALLRPSLRRGVRWSPEAVGHVLAAAKGSPYLIQLYGDHTWRQATPGPDGLITPKHAKAGIRTGERELRNGLFRGRWNRASEREQEYLIAIAACLGADGTAMTRDIAAHLGRSAAQLSHLRQRLRDKGIIDTPRYGAVGFSIPGFERFVSDEATGER